MGGLVGAMDVEEDHGGRDGVCAWVDVGRTVGEVCGCEGGRKRR